MKTSLREKVIKAWKVTGRDTEGRIVQLSRRYHSLQAANEFAELAKKQGVEGVEVRTVQSYER